AHRTAAIMLDHAGLAAPTLCLSSAIQFITPQRPGAPLPAECDASRLPAMASGSNGIELSRSQTAFAFALVTLLFFTWGFAYGLLDVLNAHFQTVFGISKTESTLLQLAYFGAYLVFSPFAGMFKGIHLGLTLYSLGAIFFWPSAKFEKYGGFVGCTFVIGCGLSCLEVAANSYISILGSPKYAAARLNFSQGFQGVASFAGPMIASRWFFLGRNATTLDTVQWVYLAVAGLGIVLNTLFYFCHLPEITGDALAAEMHDVGIDTDQEPFWKQYHCIFGWCVSHHCEILLLLIFVIARQGGADCCKSYFWHRSICILFGVYTKFSLRGAQVAVAALAVNYLVGQNIGIDKSQASQLFSYCQITFTVGRFVGVVLLRYVDPALLLTIYGVCCTVFSLGVAYGPGRAGVGCLFALFFFESICYPVIFTLGTKNLGRHTKRGSSLIVMGVGGGAWYPPAAASIADRDTTAHSYIVPFSGYVAVAVYAAGLVIDQAVKGGFRFRSIDEIEQRRAQMEKQPAYDRSPPFEVEKKANDEEFVESV
ncbi:Glucose/galactose transporter, partial [Grifola frondosa]